MLCALQVDDMRLWMEEIFCTRVEARAGSTLRGGMSGDSFECSVDMIGMSLEQSARLGHLGHHYRCWLVHREDGFYKVF